MKYPYILAALTLTLGLSASALAQDSTPEIGPELIVYTGTGLPTDLADALVQPFADYMDETYGVPVNVRTVPGAIPQSWLTLQTEWPNPTGDVYLLYNQNVKEGIGLGYWVNLQDQYSAEEWSTFDADALAAMDLEGYAVPMDISAWVLAVQNSLDAGAVTSVADLAKPEFAGRVTFDSALSVASGYNAIASAAAIRGDDWRSWFVDGKFDEAAARPTFELVASWADNALTLTQGSGSISPLLRRGEALVSAWWWHNVMAEVAAGTPIHAVEPSEGVVSVVQASPVISSASRNPVAAIEWVKFYQSSVATEAAKTLNYYNRVPRSNEEASPEWAEFAARANFLYMDEFRATMLDPAYNVEVLDLYNRVVIQGQ
ncbi:substrate-binding domain-containing protein [Devosia sp. YIM 151766]|uniref:ABC transporter substrate-binding protein n=1 Tax=Devosia sp. YIM 151766 TaxID=3017325 RepID=UPI00255C5938|nr:substrate-binding domain-containing protein [Devosia sp. YIM 151766]WIY53043.1 substrate-binding domain-containing protein [Devosia sp. YIM 151766]